MNSDNTNPELTRFERLAALLSDDDKNIDSMSHEQLAQYLKENKVEPQAAEKRFKIIQKRAEARLRLEVAHRRRLVAVEKANQIVSSGADAVTVIKERVRALIENLGKGHPEQAQLYAREFENATAEDLLSLEEDLRLLEDESPNDAKNDKQDSR
jgi:hypothetical protein